MEMVFNGHLRVLGPYESSLLELGSAALRLPLVSEPIYPRKELKCLTLLKLSRKPAMMCSSSSGLPELQKLALGSRSWVSYHIMIESRTLIGRKPPNAARILRSLGLLEEVLKFAIQPAGNIMRRYANDSEICSRTHVRPASERYGAPMLVIHRGDLQKILLAAAVKELVKIRTSQKVMNVDANFEARVQLASGEWVQGDLLIGADGIHSLVRRRIASYCGVKDRITHTGDSAYRVTIAREKLNGEAEILQQLDQGISTRWMGPMGHIMAYPMRQDRSLYNMVFVHLSKPGKVNNKHLWSQKGDIEEMMNHYQEWSPTVKRLISYITPSELMEWPLNLHTTLPSWVVNKVALLGDACHPMLPYIAQGAAQAIEDAGVLAVCLSKTSEVPLALKVYEAMRKARAETIQNSATTMRRVLHLPDGPEQKERDQNMKGAGNPGGKNPDLWADPAFQDLMWGVDVMSETLAQWTDLSNEIFIDAL